MKILLVLIVAIVAFRLYVQFSPVNAAQWQIDPFTAPDPGAGGVKYTTEQGLSVYSQGAAELVSILRAQAMATPRTRLIAADGHRFTFETRSLLWTFPDYTTFEARESSDGTELAIIGRLRFGKSDLGVNKARVDRWLSAIPAS